jgi:AAA ATPase domain
MDLLRQSGLATQVAEFMIIVTKCINVIKDVSGTKDTETTASSNTVLLEILREQSNTLDFTPSSGDTFLSEADVTLHDICKRCQQLSAELQHALELSNGKDQTLLSTSINGANHAQFRHRMKQQVDSIRSITYEKLALRSIANLDGMIKELNMKNIRLNLRRTEELGQLKTEVMEVFKKCKSKTLDDIEAISFWQQMDTVIRKVIDCSAEQAILGDLYFLTMHHRQELIAKEHDDTFKWIFDEAGDNSTTFAQWLTNDESIFWVSGKPGSGKSTLLKFLAENPKTTDMLKGWAGGDNLITASYYFWCSAKDPLMKSDLGLLRSILFQILRQHGQLIPHAFPEPWSQRQNGDGIVKRFVPDSTAQDFHAAFSRIAATLVQQNIKICLFIDGLDEFQGEMADVINLVKLLSQSSNVKACLSSRPWQEFQAKFGGDNPWKLYIHELTREDMHSYVTSLFQSDERFHKLESGKQTEKAIQPIIKEIVDAAEGVFLWVFLVVQALLLQVSESDWVADMQQRLASIPHDLDEYFEKLLFDIDVESREQSARLFLLTLSAVETLPLMSYWFAENTTLQHVLDSTQGTFNEDTAAVYLQDMTNLLESRCKGLLKIHHNGEDPVLENYNWLFQFRVDFLHRTVGDFLQTAKIRKLFDSWVKLESGFNVDLEVCKASLATVKAIPSEAVRVNEPGQVLSVLHLFFSHAKRLEKTPSLASSRTFVIKNMIHTLKAHDKDSDMIKHTILGPGNYWACERSLDFVLLYHCVSYSLVRFALLQDTVKAKFPEDASGLLSACLSYDVRTRTTRPSIDLESIQMLLKQGLDPNRPWGDRGLSFWQ